MFEGLGGLVQHGGYARGILQLNKVCMLEDWGGLVQNCGHARFFEQLMVWVAWCKIVATLVELNS